MQRCINIFCWGSELHMLGCQENFEDLIVSIMSVQIYGKEKTTDKYPRFDAFCKGF